MRREQKAIFLFILRTGFFTMLLCAHTASGQTQGQSVATAVSVQGTVDAQAKGTTQWHAVKLNDVFGAGDTIRVGERSRADVSMLDQSVLRLNENTTMTIQAPKQETGVIDLLRGAAHFFSRGPKSLEVQTPFTVAGVRGTEFSVRVEPAETLLSVFEGTVVAENSAGSLTITSGQSAVAEAGKAPVLRVVVHPRDAVNWTLYYPPVIYFRPEEFPALGDWQEKVRQSIEFYRKGNLQKALESIATVPATIQAPRFFAYRASLLLAVGRVDDANTDIERALSLNPGDGDALSLQAIIALVQNQKERALEIATRASTAAPDSATALIALSFAQQGMFDLDGARSSLKKAVELDPQNALAWARLAELWSSSGELDQALDAAKKAVALDPTLSRTQTVLGFAYLTEVRTKEARDAFEQAIALDQGDPLPRLGLGLERIREGCLQEGSRQIEIAASLDPGNSLVRSYLGKAYYEEKRTSLAEREYATAKTLDPKDPTAFFYDAIQKQTTNRPVEALHDFQDAIELNDNRAVYRSRLLLDSDLAARSAALARIYSDLGFQQLALVEGWKSVNTDPSNFSAHRFLADSYSVLPRHQIARVSELLQSQLLQPINITPIQPRLAESNLLLVSSQGPATLSFNEFNPLFNRNGAALQTSGLFGEHDTYGGEGVASGIYQNASFSAGGFHLTTDGFRQNADQQDDIANAFFQYELSPKASIQGEFRYRNTEHGDLQQRFFPEDFMPGERDNDTTYTYRAGGRYAFSPSSILLGSFIYQDADFGVRDSLPAPPATFVRFKNPESSYGAELQHLLRSQYVNLVSGLGYFDINGRVDQVVDVDLPPPIGPQITATSSTDLEHVNLYTYSYFNLRENLTLTLGGSGDFLSGDSPDVGTKNQFNPKLGLTWEPIPGTTLRGAVFRALKRTLITNQTLEPTQVAGFNQFFDDINGTTAWEYGGAIDQKFTTDLFGGVQYSERLLQIPVVDVISNPDVPTVRQLDSDEYLVNTYLFWTPHQWLALRLQYMFERFELPSVTGQPVVNTNRVPLGINFFHPSGLSTGLTATYWNQNGEFERLQTGNFESGQDDFWTVDASINYRLPKRYGFITFGVTNLFDEDFRFFDTDIANPLIQPTRTLFGRVTLSLG